MARKIEIFDTTLRDGEQVPGAKLNAHQKVEIARQLARLNVDIIEAGFPISSPGDLDAVQRVSREIKGPIIAALARTVKEDIDAVWEGIKEAERPRIHMVLGSSDIHLENKLRMDREKAIEMGVESVKYAKRFCPDIEYSTEDASRADLEFLCRIIEAVIKAGATVINIPDTVGYAIPEQYGGIIKHIREKIPATDHVIISVHCHNDLGLATSNSLAAIKNGASQVECTINSIGERAGNTAMEEVVMALKVRSDYYDAYTGIKTTELMRTSKMVSRIMNIPVQPNKAIIGSNAFAHSSGIHQDGILKDRSTYEIMKPEDVGVTQHRMVLTARSGRSALRHKLKEIGFELNQEMIDRVYKRFLSVADAKKEVTEEDLQVIAEIELSKVPETFSLNKIQTVCGNDIMTMAAVSLKKNGDITMDTAGGNGPVDALFKTINRIVGKDIKLNKFSLNAITEGTDALGEAHVEIEANGAKFTGRATSPDIIEASVRAYINAINRVFAAEIMNES